MYIGVFTTEIRSIEVKDFCCYGFRLEMNFLVFVRRVCYTVRYVDDRKLQILIRDTMRNELRSVNDWMTNFDRRLAVMERELQSWRQLGVVVKQNVPQIKQMIIRSGRNETILEENILELQDAIGRLEEQISAMHEDQSEMAKWFSRDHEYQDYQIRRIEGAMDLEPLPRKQVLRIREGDGSEITRQ